MVTTRKLIYKTINKLYSSNTFSRPENGQCVFFINKTAIVKVYPQ